MLSEDVLLVKKGLLLGGEQSHPINIPDACPAHAITMKLSLGLTILDNQLNWINK